MDRSLKWRTIALVVGLLLCAGLLAPTWPGSDSLPSWFPFKKKISLGLDLQGGVHIVYSIALERAVDDKASEIKRDLDARYADEKISATVKLPAALGAVTVIPADASKKAEIESQILSDYHDVVHAVPCPPGEAPAAICIEVSQSYAEGIKKSALTNAVNTIRERINEKGVSEPSVKLRFTQWTPEDGSRNERDFFLEAGNSPPRFQLVSLDWIKKYQGCLNQPEIHKELIQPDARLRCQLSGRGAMELYLYGDKKLGVPGIIDSAPDLKI